MNNLTLAAQRIKDTISAVDFAEAVGLEVKHGRCKCPIHGGGDYNCVLYKGDRGFYCHVCKAGGDVIKLAQEYHGMGFKEAITWFNDTFHLRMDINSPMTPEARRRAEEAQRRRIAEKEFTEWKERMQFDLFLTADRILEKLEEMRDANRPRTADEEWNEAFCTAVRLIPEARACAKELMLQCVKEKKDG